MRRSYRLIANNKNTGVDMVRSDGSSPWFDSKSRMHDNGGNSRETVLHLHLLHFLHELLLLQRAELCLEVRVHLFLTCNSKSRSNEYERSVNENEAAKAAARQGQHDTTDTIGMIVKSERQPSVVVATGYESRNHRSRV